jgi:hypothetical protein
MKSLKAALWTAAVKEDEGALSGESSNDDYFLMVLHAVKLLNCQWFFMQ